MTREEFSTLSKGHILYLDGATGSNLVKAGMPSGVCPEQWIPEHRDVMLKLQKDYNVKGLRINNSIQTNGMLIDDEWPGYLAENDFLVGLSIDGPKDIHDQFRLDSAGKGTHSRLMKTVSLLKKHNAAFNVLCVVNNAVARYGRRVYNFFKQQGIGYLQFIPCLDEYVA